MANEYRRIKTVDDTNGAEYTGEYLYVQVMFKNFVKGRISSKYPTCAKVCVSGNWFRVRYDDLEKFIGKELITKHKGY